ncbi:MAG: hypothetical protein M0Q40_04465 [Limnochordia bacterium]|nr:hypothetical protein [Limnochordia bacterium]
MGKRRETFKLAATFTGAIIGAGFASGREVLHFFGRFGTWGFAGAFLAMIGFTCLGGCLFLLSYRSGSHSYLEVLPHLGGTVMGKALDFWMITMLVVSVGVMFAGSGSLFQQQLHLPEWMGSFSMAGLVALILRRETSGLLSASGFLVPPLCLIPVLLAINVWIQGGQVDIHHPIIKDMGYPAYWWSSAIIYVVYNICLGAGVITSFGRAIKDEVQAMSAAVLGGSLLGVVLGALLFTLLSFRTEVLHLEIPLLAIMEGYGPLWTVGFSIVLWLAMLTTAAANTHAIACRFDGYLCPYRRAVSLSLVVGLGIGSFGFGDLVKAAYPLYGYAGLVLLAFSLVSGLFRKLSRK